MKINATVSIICDLLREDIVKSLGYDGVEAILDWYDSITEYDFDQSLFWVWSRYDNAIEALRDYDDNIVDEFIAELSEADEDEPDKKVEFDEDELNAKCLKRLNEMTSVIMMDNDEIIVYSDF